MSTTLKETPPSQDKSLSDVTVSAPRRIIKKMPELAPLEPERRYVQPHVSYEIKNILYVAKKILLIKSNKR
jgi:hypothetical protein